MANKSDSTAADLGKNSLAEEQEVDRGSRRNQTNDNPSADLVRVYLNGIGKTALLSAEDEVELAQRIEVGLYAEYKLANAERSPALKSATSRSWFARARKLVPTCWKQIFASSFHWPSATPVAECRSST